MLRLYIDRTRRRLVSGYSDNTPADEPVFTQGDRLPVELHFLDATGLSYLPYTYYDPSGDDVKLALGLVDSVPTAGTFTLTYGGQTTSAIAAAASASDVQTALQALATVGASGANTLTVTGDDGGPWYVSWSSAGTRSLLSADSSLLVPASAFVVDTLVDGSVSAREQQVIKFEVADVAYMAPGDFSALAAAAVVLTAVASNGGWKIALTPTPIGGTFTLSVNNGASTQTTTPLAYTATAAEVQAALEALSNVAGGEAVVTSTAIGSQDSGGPWLAVFSGGALNAGNQPTLTASAAGLTVPVGLAGTLLLNTQGIEALVARQESVAATLEIERTDADSNVTTDTPGRRHNPQ